MSLVNVWIFLTFWNPFVICSTNGTTKLGVACRQSLSSIDVWRLLLKVGSCNYSVETRDNQSFWGCSIRGTILFPFSFKQILTIDNVVDHDAFFYISSQIKYHPRMTLFGNCLLTFNLGVATIVQYSSLTIYGSSLELSFIAPILTPHLSIPNYRYAHSQLAVNLHAFLSSLSILVIDRFICNDGWDRQRLTKFLDWNSFCQVAKNSKASESFASWILKVIVYKTTLVNSTVISHFYSSIDAF